jgi:hypothetical protein
MSKEMKVKMNLVIIMLVKSKRRIFKNEQCLMAERKKGNPPLELS